MSPTAFGVAEPGSRCSYRCRGETSTATVINYLNRLTVAKSGTGWEGMWCTWRSDTQTLCVSTFVGQSSLLKRGRITVFQCYRSTSAQHWHPVGPRAQPERCRSRTAPRRSNWGGGKISRVLVDKFFSNYFSYQDHYRFHKLWRETGTG